MYIYISWIKTKKPVYRVTVLMLRSNPPRFRKKKRVHFVLIRIRRRREKMREERGRRHKPQRQRAEWHDEKREE